MKELFKIKSTTDVGKLAGAIAHATREGVAIELQAMGAGALNQAVKATIVAKGYLSVGGIDISLIPSFKDIEAEGEERTVVVMKVKVEGRDD